LEGTYGLTAVRQNQPEWQGLQKYSKMFAERYQRDEKYGAAQNSEQEKDNETRKRRSLTSDVSVSDLSRVAGTFGERSTIGAKGRNLVNITNEQSIAYSTDFSV
jgi:hypothetical protein